MCVFRDYEGGKMVNGILKHLSHDHDIGLVKVKVPFIFDDFVKPICLPTEPEFEMSDGNGIITGFGTMEDGLSDRFEAFRLKFSFRTQFV